MRFVVTCAFVLVISSVVHSQDEASTDATPGNDGEVKPETTDRGASKPRPMCPSLIKFLTERGFNFSGRKPSSRNLPDDFEMFRFSPSNYNPSNLSPPNYNPSNFNPSNYNPSFYGRRSWNPPQGRREGSRSGFGGPTFDIPNRDDVEFL